MLTQGDVLEWKLVPPINQEFSVEFFCSGIQFKRILVLNARNTIIYTTQESNVEITVYENGWIDDGYKKLIFSTTTDSEFERLYSDIFNTITTIDASYLVGKQFYLNDRVTIPPYDFKLGYYGEFQYPDAEEKSELINFYCGYPDKALEFAVKGWEPNIYDADNIILESNYKYRRIHIVKLDKLNMYSTSYLASFLFANAVEEVPTPDPDFTTNFKTFDGATQLATVTTKQPTTLDLTVTGESKSITVTDKTGATEVATYTSANPNHDFVGLATTPNATTPEVVQGTQYKVAWTEQIKDLFDVWKKSVKRFSKDISTFAGWADITGGTHKLSIVARANGYLDSDPIDLTIEKPYLYEYTQNGTILKLNNAPYEQIGTEVIIK